MLPIPLQQKNLTSTFCHCLNYLPPKLILTLTPSNCVRVNSFLVSSKMAAPKLTLPNSLENFNSVQPYTYTFQSSANLTCKLSTQRVVEDLSPTAMPIRSQPYACHDVWVLESVVARPHALPIESKRCRVRAIFHGSWQSSALSSRWWTEGNSTAE